MDLLEKDLIKELLNIGMGRAAQRLSSTLGEEVLMSIPELAIHSGDLPQEENPDRVKTVITQHFEGEANIVGFLVFHDDRDVTYLVDKILGNQFDTAELVEIEAETLVEIGNIIINSCVGTICNASGIFFNSGMPELVRDRLKTVLGRALTGYDSTMVHVSLMFQVSNRNLAGELILVFDETLSIITARARQSLLGGIN